MKDAGMPTPAGDDRLLYVGRDNRGIELEIVAVLDDRPGGDLAVIHAMPTYYRTKGERNEVEKDQSG